MFTLSDYTINGFPSTECIKIMQVSLETIVIATESGKIYRQRINKD